MCFLSRFDGGGGFFPALVGGGGGWFGGVHELHVQLEMGWRCIVCITETCTDRCVPPFAFFRARFLCLCGICIYSHIYIYICVCVCV